MGLPLKVSFIWVFFTTAYKVLDFGSDVKSINIYSKNCVDCILPPTLTIDGKYLERSENAIYWGILIMNRGASACVQKKPSKSGSEIVNTGSMAM